MSQNGFEIAQENAEPCTEFMKIGCRIYQTLLRNIDFFGRGNQQGLINFSIGFGGANIGNLFVQ